MKKTSERDGEGSGAGFGTVLEDTSLLIEQQKLSKYARPVRDALSAYEFKGASSYSRLEFKRAWLQKLNYIHGVCRESATRSVGDVLDWISAKLTGHPKQKRRLQTCLDAITRFLELDGKAISGAAQLARLRAFCKASILTASEALGRMVTGEFRGTQCVRAEELPRELSDGSLDVAIPKCRRKKIRCAIHEFFASREATFAAIADRIDAEEDPSDQLKAISKAVRSAQKDPAHLCDSDNCGKLADAIIAVDGRDMAEFAANNDREWVTIASAMRKALVNPVKGTRVDP